MSFFLLSGDTGNVFEVNINDSVAVSDTVLRATNTVRALTDTATVSETTKLTASFGRSGTDTISISDSQFNTVLFNRTLSDNASVSDSLVASSQYVRAQQDSVSVSDSVLTTMAFGRVVSDTISVSDSAFLELFFQRSTTETISISDSSTTTATYYRTATDSVTITDSVNIPGRVEVSVSDSVSVSDLASTALSYLRNNAESVSTSDSATLSVFFSWAASDALSVADNASTATSFVRALVDSLAITDAVSPVIVTPIVPVVSTVRTVKTYDLYKGLIAMQSSDARSLQLPTKGQSVQLSFGAPTFSTSGQIRGGESLSNAPLSPSATLAAILQLESKTNHPKTSRKAASEFARLYDSFAHSAQPVAILTGRRQIMEAALVPAFAGKGPKSTTVNTIVQAFTAYWIGVPLVGGGAVTSFPGAPVLNAELNFLLSMKSNSEEQAARKLLRCFTNATNSVQYAIPPGVVGLLKVFPSFSV